MKVFEVIEIEVYECVRTVRTNLFSSRYKAITYFNEVWERAKSAYCGFNGKSDTEFQELMEFDKWVCELEMKENSVELYEDGNASQNSYSLYIEEKEMEM